VFPPFRHSLSLHCPAGFASDSSVRDILCLSSFRRENHCGLSRTGATINGPEYIETPTEDFLQTRLCTQHASFHMTYTKIFRIFASLYTHNSILSLLHSVLLIHPHSASFPFRLMYPNYFLCPHFSNASLFMIV